MSQEWSERSGERVVALLYVSIVLLAGVMGFVLGTIRPENLEPVLFGVISLPPTPFGVALYGIGTVGVGLGVLLGLVAVISRRSAETRHSSR